MKYFAVLLPMKDEEKSKEFRPAHLEFLARMKKEKKVVMFGRFADGAGGLVIYQGESLEDIESWVKQDPYVMNEARYYEIHEWDMVSE
ncbi:YciI family protein [Siminovitchia sediminis]|uniref:YciI family protein n=1 Tax=Siminovitchia sediminis TaxID=1274353 RepID=A0ABW4KFW2_9BACI